MANKTGSSVGFWTTMTGGGLIVLILTAFILTHGSKNTVISMGGKRMMTGNASTGAVGMTMPREAMPTMDEYGYADKSMPSSLSSIAPYYPPSAGETAATAEPRVIKTASLLLEVPSSRERSEEIAALAAGQKGFVESSNIVENDDGTTSAYVTIRVPSTSFETTLTALREMAIHVLSETTSGRDVTEQYTDLEARLKAAQAEEAQYLEILKKATSVSDILSVTQYLSQVRSEIESIQGQITYLGNQTEYSTISITLTEQPNLSIPTNSFDLLRDIKQAGAAVIVLGQALLTFAIWFLIIGGAIAIPSVLIIYAIYRLIKRILP